MAKSAMHRPISEAFGEIAELAIALGVAPIRDKLWEHQIDAKWFVAINGYREEREFQIDGSPVKLQPFEAYLMFNGWPAGFLHPYGGCIAAGKVANEDTLIEALREAKRKAEA